MGSLTPPWADELLSRNTKIARKMMSSMSTESYFEPGQNDISVGGQQRNSPTAQRVLSVPKDDNRSPSPSLPLMTSNSSKVVDPPVASARMASTQSLPLSMTSSSSSFTTGNNSSRVKRQQYARNTEKLSPIRNERDSMFVDEDQDTKKGFEMTNGEDLSILEYGPGIVKKLRSRYQSLALRQYSARPSLRRSASLENCLDAVSAEELAATLESKISNGNGVHHELDEINEMNDRQHRGRNRFQTSSISSDSRTSSPVVSHNEKQLYEQNGSVGRNLPSSGGGGGPRGRTTGPDASARRDRMRRARSVDALHRTKREEEILEKFKHVVLPKEEIVIIEVSNSKPPDSAGNIFSQVENGHDNKSEKRFPTRLLLTSNNLRNSVTGASILDQQTANRVRNLMISPEHELPPHDIVRETARIFEKNQENLNRRIGQALRLSKSSSQSSNMGSPPLTPPSPTPSTTIPSSTLQKAVMAQSTTSSSSAMQPQDKSFSTKTSSRVAEANTAQTNNIPMANGPSHGQKQIGIIKPTLSSNTTINGVGDGVNNVNGKIANSCGGSASVGGENRVRSPILSPIGFNSNHKPLIQNSHKPPLSPKPIFTSSPKVNISGGSGFASAKEKFSNETKESPSTSPILIIENRDRSISPFKSESPIPRVGGGETGRVKSPVSSSRFTTSPTNLVEERKDAFMRSTSPLNGKTSPVTDKDGTTTNQKRLENQNSHPAGRTGSPEGENAVKPSKTVTNSVLQNGESKGSSDHHRQQVTIEQPAPPPPPRSSSTPSPVAGDSSNTSASTNNKVSQLRTHQKQKSTQGGNGSMVFNFTSRKQVPDYIEDDGLRRGRTTAGDGQMNSMEDGFSSLDRDVVDSKLVIPAFEGANVIINGRSSIQKKPKSQKLSISFNEEATTTHEYPSESSFVVEDDQSENENTSPKKPSVTGGITGSSLGSYTPKVGTNAYQLGSYTTFDGSSGHNMKKSSNSKDEEAENDFIEDYLKPNTESTTWSNEMSADILF